MCVTIYKYIIHTLFIQKEQAQKIAVLHVTKKLESKQFADTGDSFH